MGKTFGQSAKGGKSYTGAGPWGNESGGWGGGRHRGQPAKGPGGLGKPSKGKRSGGPAPVPPGGGGLLGLLFGPVKTAPPAKPSGLSGGKTAAAKGPGAFSAWYNGGGKKK